MLYRPNCDGDLRDWPRRVKLVLYFESLKLEIEEQRPTIKCSSNKHFFAVVKFTSILSYLSTSDEKNTCKPVYHQILIFWNLVQLRKSLRNVELRDGIVLLPRLPNHTSGKKNYILHPNTNPPLIKTTYPWIPFILFL